MVRLHHSDYSSLLDFVAELQRPVPLTDFGVHLVEITARMLPGATVTFDQINEATGEYAFDHNLELAGRDLENVFNRLQQVYQQNPIYSYIQRGGSGPVVDIAELTPAREFQMTDFYQDIFRPFGLTHQVQVLVPRAGWLATMTINRDRGISKRFQTLLTLASRHIAAAHQTASLIEKLTARPSGADIASGLTPREVQVVDWLGEGKRNSEIAVILGCSPRTIDKHVENILRKTGAETRTAAVRCASDPRRG